MLSALPLLQLLTTTPLALPALLAAGAAAILLVCLAAPQLDPVSGPVRGRAVGLGVRARQAAFLRLRDPNAPGRSRPRAPTAVFAAA
ncbi:hypothetical protein FPZ12_024940 [Amycolatopsis acidicola]|uniref:Uncharacterized protein n=1 Tax=Amycolatopsis acidicola TaxID=2596893 RepID=A0A5N0V2F5_9PSEU|nr:hypothetical protein FPZ12_024940 [Amycolatopsis acidicola]